MNTKELDLTSKEQRISKSFINMDLSNKKPKWRVIGDYFLNVNKIHPLMQSHVRNIINELIQYNNVKRIIVFGSSTTWQCHSESDLDIYLELSDNNEPFKQYLLSYPKNIDYWNNYSVDKRLLNEIISKGVVVYE